MTQGLSTFAAARANSSIIGADALSSSATGCTTRIASRPGSVVYLSMIWGQSRAPKPVASSGFGIVTPGRLAVAQSE